MRNVHQACQKNAVVFCFLIFISLSSGILDGLCYATMAFPVYFNPLYSGGLFHCYMLDKFICHLRGVRSILSLFSIFDGKSYLQTM